MLDKYMQQESKIHGDRGDNKLLSALDTSGSTVIMCVKFNEINI